MLLLEMFDFRLEILLYRATFLSLIENQTSELYLLPSTPRLNFPVTRFGLLKFALLCTQRVGIILRKLRISGPLDKRFLVSLGMTNWWVIMPRCTSDLILELISK